MDENDLTLEQAFQQPEQPPQPESSPEDTVCPPDTLPTQEQLPQAEPTPQPQPEQTALDAAQLAVNELGKYKQENEQLKVQLAQFQQAQQQQSQATEQKIENTLLQPPQFPLKDLMYADDNTLQQAQQQYAQQMADYMEKQTMQKYQPILQEFEQTKQTQAMNQAIEQVQGMPEFAALADVLPQAKKLINSNPTFKNMNPTEAIVIASLIAKGSASLNTPPPKQRTAEDVLSEFMQNQDATKLYEAKRLEQFKNRENPPVFTASKGAVNAPLNVPKKPEDFDEAFSGIYDLLNLN